MTKKDGFTLIEMLVVVAIIGILSSVVLTALGPAREKAKDTRIIEELSQIRSLAETMYDGDYDALPTIRQGDQIDLIANLNVKEIAASIKQQGGELVIQKPTSPATIYLTYSKLNTKVGSDPKNMQIQFYCRDSAGRSAYLAAIPNSNVYACPL